MSDLEEALTGVVREPVQRHPPGRPVDGVLDREGVRLPSHARLRRLIESSMPRMDTRRRVRLSELIGRLYTLRIDADYKPSVEVEGVDAREALSIMKTIFESF
jgi:hypothetical protein